MSGAVKYWWLTFIAGLAVFIVGLLAFIFPAASYVTFAILFGYLILWTGILYTFFAVSNRRQLMGWGWYLTGGILEIVFALFLLFRWDLAMISLPVFLGVWLMFRGAGAIATAGDLKNFGVAGMGWSIVAGIFMIICSILILWNPVSFGLTFTVVYIGLGLLVMGLQMMLFSWQLRKMHLHFKNTHTNGFVREE
jgi:uncharacterized membrane protein HdeD (DUF308 family)